MKQRVDRQKPVIGIHKQTGEQVYFPSPYYAPGFKRAGIKEAISGRAKSHRGFTWRYPKKNDASKRIDIPYDGYEIKIITHPHFGPEPVKVFAIKVKI